MNDTKTLSDIMRERRNQVQGLDRFNVASALAEQNPMAIERGIQGLTQQANPFQVSASNFIGEKAQDIYNKRLGDVKGSLLRNAIFRDAERDSGITNLAQQEHIFQEQEAFKRAQEAARKKAKKRGLGAALGGLAGAGLGAMFGGPMGAQIGGGLGTSIGGSLG